MKLLGTNKSKVIKNENDENFLPLEITEVVLVYCNIVNNDYQKTSRVLYKFVPNNSLSQLLDISHKNVMFLNNFDSWFSYIELWFTNQNSRQLEMTDDVNNTLIIN